MILIRLRLLQLIYSSIDYTGVAMSNENNLKMLLKLQNFTRKSCVFQLNIETINTTLNTNII